MKKIAFILLMALCLPFFGAYAQDCSERIQQAGRIYEKYKKNYDKRTFDEARKQLQNIINTPGAPEGCKKQARQLLSTWKPVYKNKAARSNVDVAPIVVKVDTIVEKRVSVDSVVNIIVQYDSIKVRRFYESEGKAHDCYQKRDYECAIDNYQTASGYGKELKMGDGVMESIDAKLKKCQKLQYNKLLDEAKQLERDGKIQEAISSYERVAIYAIDNALLDETSVGVLTDKVDYLQSVQQMFDIVDQADEYYRAKEWELAKQELDLALDISDTLGWKRGTIHWQHRRDTLISIISAGDRVHDYATLENTSESYEQLRPQVVYAVQTALLRFNDIDPDTLSVEFLVTPDGRYRSSVSLAVSRDTLLAGVIKGEIEKAAIRMETPKFFGQPVSAKARYEFLISVNSAAAKVKVSSRRLKETPDNPLLIGIGDAQTFIQKTGDTVKKVRLAPGCKPFLYGNFMFRNATATVDNSTRSGFHLEKYHGNGGPANTLLSLVMPGLGRHRVTYGWQNGVATTVFFYGFLGASIGCYAYGINEKYHTEVNLKDELFHNYFKFKKNDYFVGMDNEKLHKGIYWTSYGFAAVAATLYVTDVMYTFIRGCVNVSHQNKYKKWSVGVFYEPASQTPILQYNYKIR